MKLCVRQTFNFRATRFGLDRPQSAYMLSRHEHNCLCRMMSDWKVELVNDNINELYVEFKGPKESKLCLSRLSVIIAQEPKCRN